GSSADRSGEGAGGAEAAPARPVDSRDRVARSLGRADRAWQLAARTPRMEGSADRRARSQACGEAGRAAPARAMAATQRRTGRIPPCQVFGGISPRPGSAGLFERLVVASRCDRPRLLGILA